MLLLLLDAVPNTGVEAGAQEAEELSLDFHLTEVTVILITSILAIMPKMFQCLINYRALWIVFQFKPKFYTSIEPLLHATTLVLLNFKFLLQQGGIYVQNHQKNSMFCIHIMLKWLRDTTIIFLPSITSEVIWNTFFFFLVEIIDCKNLISVFIFALKFPGFAPVAQKNKNIKEVFNHYDWWLSSEINCCCFNECTILWVIRVCWWSSGVWGHMKVHINR